MGSFYGHLVPGLVLAFYGSWWLIFSLLTHFKLSKIASWSDSRRRNDIHVHRWTKALKERSWIPIACAPRLPAESILKILLCSVGLFIELFVDMTNNETQLIWKVVNLGSHPISVEKTQHATMYSFFILSGIMDLESLCNVCLLPKRTSKVLFALAFWMEGMLFYFHTGGRTMLDSNIHFILTMAVFVCVLSISLRVFYPSNTFLNVAFSLGLLFQGTWLMQAAFIIFGNNRDWWRVNDHEDVMFAYLIAAWHVLCIIVVTLLLWLLVRLLDQWGCCITRVCGNILPAKMNEKCFGKYTLTTSGPPDEETKLTSSVEDVAVSKLDVGNHCNSSSSSDDPSELGRLCESIAL